jgi:hypothetical protein
MLFDTCKLRVIPRRFNFSISNLKIPLKIACFVTEVKDCVVNDVAKTLEISKKSHKILEAPEQAPEAEGQQTPQAA